MKNLLIILLACLITAVQSCGKEESDTRTTQNPSDSTGKLVKLSQVHVPDSFEYFVRTYQYESNGKIRSITTVQRIKDANGIVKTLTGVARFYRDANGRIERIGSDPDTSSSNVLLFYSGATSTVPSYIKFIRNSASGTKVLDSVACSYSTNGTLIKEVHFIKNSTGVLDSSMYFEYAYDNRGNLKERTQFSDSADNKKFEKNIAYSFEYDDKINPLYFDEFGYWFLEGVFGYTSSPNNVVKQINNYALFPSDQVTYSFTYNSEGRPLSSFKTLGPDVITRYFYE